MGFWNENVSIMFSQDYFIELIILSPLDLVTPLELK